MGNKRKPGDAAAEPGKPAGEWGAFVTEAEQPLLAAATRSINAQSTVQQACGKPLGPAIGPLLGTGANATRCSGKLRRAQTGPSSVTSRRAGVL